MASNTVGTLQIACNPLRPTCEPMTFKNLPAQARLRIYTLTGALVKDITTNSTGRGGGWDGTNQDSSPAASGVYFIFAQGNGTKQTYRGRGAAVSAMRKNNCGIGPGLT